MGKKKIKFKTPDTFTVCFLLLFIVAILTWIIPGGAYEYVDPTADKLQPLPAPMSQPKVIPRGFSRSCSPRSRVSTIPSILSFIRW